MDLHAIVIAYLEATAPILSALAWPAAVVLIAVVFRKPLQSALGKIEEFSGPGFKAKLQTATTETQNAALESLVADQPSTTATNEPIPQALSVRLGQRAEDSPIDAMLEAFETVEEWYRETLLKYGLATYNEAQSFALSWMARLAVEHGLINTSTLDAVDGLATLRNLAVHGPARQIGAREAREYLVLADAVLYSSRSALAKYERERGAPPPKGSASA